MKTIHEITVDLAKPDYNDPLIFHRGDVNSREIRVKVLNDGQEVTISNEITAEFDAVIGNQITAASLPATVDPTNNYISLILGADALSLAGKMKIDLRITEGTEIITARTIKAIVEPAAVTRESSLAPPVSASIIEIAREAVIEYLEDSETYLGTVVNVAAEGVKNDGTLTDLGLALEADAEDTVYYFPKGTYRINGFSFNGAENVTVLAPEAKFTFDGTGSMTALLELKNCNGMKLIGGDFDGDGKAQTGIQLNNAPNSAIRDVFIHNIGNAQLEYTAGIDAVNDCSHTVIENVRVSGVHAGKITATGRIKIPGQDEYVSAGYIFATGIRFHAGLGGYSKDILIDHPVIDDIGYLGEGVSKVNCVPATREEYTYTDGGQQHTAYIYKVGETACIKDIVLSEEVDSAVVDYARIDGDGIHLAQRPDEVADRSGRSYAVIRNAQITDCAKRALKIATRCVEIDGGNIDVSSWSTAVGFQFTDGSIIRNTKIHNGTYSCMTVLADGKMTVENCAFSSTNGAGNGLAMTLEAQFSDAQDNPIAPLPENLLVRNCRFDDVNVPVIALLTSVSETRADSNSVRIEDCEIGFFKGEAAIYLSPNRFNSIKSLVVRDNIFTHGSSAAEIHAANVERYDESCAVEQGVLYIGTAEDGAHVDPIELLEVNNPALSEDFDEVFRLYRFTTARRYLGGSPARADWVYDYPELLKLDAKSQTTEDSITYSVDNNGVISVSAAEASTLRKVWIPLKEPIVFNGNEVYELIVTPNKLNSPKVSVRLYTTNSMSSVDNMITIAGLNNLDRHVIISDTSKTATYLAVVCSPESGSSVGIESGTEFTASLKSRKPVVKGSQGRDGKSAYEIAVDNGFEGTEAAWLLSLKGADGFSPIATVTQTASGATVTITDKNGTTTANISNGADGQDYVLTNQDKTDIANIVLQLLPTTQGVLYGNTNN